MSGVLSTKPLLRPGRRNDMFKCFCEGPKLRENCCCWRYRESCFSSLRSAVVMRADERIARAGTRMRGAGMCTGYRVLVKPLNPRGVRYMDVCVEGKLLTFGEADFRDSDVIGSHSSVAAKPLWARTRTLTSRASNVTSRLPIPCWTCRNSL